MLSVFELPGEFYREFDKKRCDIYIYGKTLDGITYARFCEACGYPFVGYIDKNIENKEDSRHITIQVADVSKEREYYYLLCAKTEQVTNEMIEMLNIVGVKGKIFTWKAFCIDTVKIDGNSCNVYKYVHSVPYAYYSIYGNEVDKDFIQSIYSSKLKIEWNKSKYFYYEKYKSLYINIDDKGRRLTTDVPDCRKIIHFFGDSRTFGMGVKDYQTIPSCLQRMINKNCEEKYKVINYGVGATGFDNLFMWLQNVQVNQGDIIFLSSRNFVLERRVKGLLDNINPIEYYKYYFDKIIEYCTKKKAKVYFFILGQADEVKENTLWEKAIFASVYVNDEYAYYVPCNITYLEAYYQDIVYDMRGVVDANHLKFNFFIDQGHYSAQGCEVIAEAIYERVFCKAKEIDNKIFTEIDKYLECNRLHSKFPFIWDDEWHKYNEYLMDNRSSCKGRVGVIVMNANPFTKGHKYLVEYATSKVDFLYVFVLEEDKSRFSFEDRYAMVKNGTAEYENVLVLRSGKFIISQNTFPEYFFKNPGEVDCTKDVEIFSLLIAPILNISCRFVGEEPYSAVTNQYNQSMKKILPKYDIDLIEIPRKAINDNVISATKVRKAIDEKDDALLKEMLPETSYNYINKFICKCEGIKCSI